ncbi:hypothetical protein AGMMS50267_04810 [Spirochaetia bacterium]|nr:hypothetical protein AGMMS50267_04810 [Spirochaetia bacterium]
MDGRGHHHFHGGPHGGHHEKPNEKLVCNLEKCVFCGSCVEVCKKEAIKVDKINKKWTLDKNLCVKCGHCIGHCKVDALEFV